MSVTEAVGRVQGIEAMLAQLFAPARTAASDGAAKADFSTVLAGVESGSGYGGAVTGNDVVADASKYLGVPYVLGGESSSGMDCSGLVQRVFADLGISVPRVVSDQESIGTKVDSLADAQPGDLLVTGGGEHIVIYAGNGKIIHAPHEGKTVSLVDNYLTDATIDTIRRVVPAAGTVSAASVLGLGGLSGTAGLGGMAGLSGAGLSALGVAPGLSAAVGTGTGASSTSGMSDLVQAAYASLVKGGSL